MNAADNLNWLVGRFVQQVAAVRQAVVVSSDGSPTMRHPRGHGAFARVVREFVVERELLSLEQAVHKMTGATARWMDIPDRGENRPGAFADLVLFDPETIADAEHGAENESESLAAFQT